MCPIPIFFLLFTKKLFLQSANELQVEVFLVSNQLYNYGTYFMLLGLTPSQSYNLMVGVFKQYEIKTQIFLCAENMRFFFSSDCRSFLSENYENNRNQNTVILLRQSVLYFFTPVQACSNRKKLLENITEHLTVTTLYAIYN